MLIPMLISRTEHDAGTPAPALAETSSKPRFSSVLEQCSAPPFAPWPLVSGDIKTPAATPPTQVTHPADKGRRQGHRRGRG